jgi:hypothetical protein
MAIPIDHNLHGQDYQNRAHLRYQNGGLIDVHAHLHLMKGKLETETFQAELLVNVALEFGVRCLWTMSPSDHIVRLKERFGDLLIFNGYIDKATQEPDDAVYRRLDQYLEAGVYAPQRRAALLVQLDHYASTAELLRAKEQCFFKGTHKLAARYKTVGSFFRQYPR